MSFRGYAMPFFVYLAILITAVFSVALEWDALVVPSASTMREMQAMSHFRGPPPTQRDAAKQDDKAHAVQPAIPQTVAGAPPPGAVNDAAPAKAGDDALAQKTAAPAPLQCDLSACAAAYFSFRASDCTYQPTSGPRRLCTKGAPEPAAAVARADGATPAVPGCHYRTCAEHYSSFNPQDCTYQPLEGPRRVCER